MTTDPLERLRVLCLAVPGAEEVETWGHPTFRVRGKMFAAAEADFDPEIFNWRFEQ